MKRVIALVFLSAFLLSSMSFAGDVKVAKVEQPQIDAPNLAGYVPDAIVIKLDESLLPSLDRSAFARGQTGIASLDRLGQQFDVASIRAQFPRTQKKMYRGRVINLNTWHKIVFRRDIEVEKVIAAYKGLKGIVDAQPIGIHRVYATPNDPNFTDQWHLNQANDHDIDAPEGWNLETGNEDIIVTIMDTGVRYYHKDLGGANASSTNVQAARGNMWINWAEKNGTPGVDDDNNGYVDDWIGWDFVDGVSGWPGEDVSTPDNDPRDFNGHGTHCSGIVAAMNNNGYAVSSPSGGWGNGSNTEFGNGVKVMPLRIGYSGRLFIYEVGYVSMDFAAQAFRYAADNGARIASCSWGSSNTGGLGDAIDYFLASGGLIFKAAGNDDNENTDYMTARNDIISVASTDENDVKSSFSSYGSWVDISAPGSNIWSTYHDHNDPANDYVASLSGTSMATPMAASVAAAIWSHDPSMTADAVRQRLFDTADDIYGIAGNSAYQGKLGAGRINLYNAVNFSTTPQPPAAPGNLTATAVSSSQINLTWSDNSSNEDGFRIERKTGTGAYAEITTVGPNVSSYSDMSLSASTTYTYRVRAYNTVGNSDYSNEASATTQAPPQPPAAPSNLAATAVSSSQINLTWIDNANNEDGFRIERKTGTGSYTEIVTVGPDVTSYSNTGLAASTLYTYRVRAYNTVGNSDYSNEASATTQAPPQPPAAPSNLAATAVSSSQINLSWTDNATNEDGFRIERKIGTAAYSEITTVGSDVTSYSDIGLAANTTYTYRVRAYNTTGNSSYSNEASATTQAASSQTLHVASMNVQVQALRRWSRASVTVQVVDETGTAVANATVTGQWSGAVSGSASFSTGSDGSGTATSSWTRSSDVFTFCVTNVTKSGYTYDEAANVVTCAGSDGSTSSVKQLSLKDVNLEEFQKQTGESIHFNYPNPFNPTTTISFLIPEASHITVEIYNILGERVATLMDREVNEGLQSVTWNANSLNGKAVGSGYFFYRISSNGKVLYTHKMLLMK